MSTEEKKTPEEMEPQEEKKPREFRGLYKYVHISVKALDIIIVACIAVIIIATVIGMRDPGFLVTFDTRGGTPVESFKQQWGELLDVPENPTREGFTFTGWYKDPSLDEKWNVETDKIETEITLYAGWEKSEK